MASYIYSGNEIEYTPTAAIAAGEIVVIGTTAANIAGIANYAIGAGVTGKITVQGVVEIDSASATTFTEGANVYYNKTSGLATATTTDYIIGKAFGAKASGDLTAKVLLNK